MRSTTAGELTTLAGTTRTITPRIKVANGSGTMIDLSSWFLHASIDHDVDQPVGGCSIDFVRANGATQSLAPLRTDSTLNVNNVPVYSPLLDLNRSVTVEVATNPIGTAPVAGDYKSMFQGTIDVVNFERSPVSIVCRDLGAPLVDRWIETEATYGTGVAGSGVGGRAVQSVIQDILDAVFGAGVYTLYTPVSPGFNINSYKQQKMSVMDALQDLVQMIGWDVRYKWDDGTSAWRLTLSQPPRAKTTPDYTFGPSAYHDITLLSLDITNIRNAITGSYRNASGLGNRAVITLTDATSITKYGRRFFYIQESDISPIGSAAEMTSMLTAALADLKDPKAEQEVDMPFFWPADISDLYRYSANSVHYDTNQDIAVVELTHDLSPNQHRTRVKVRGTPIGMYATWLGRGGTIGGGVGGQALPPIPYIQPLNTEGSEASWNIRFYAVYGTGGGGTNLTYTVKNKSAFGAITTLSSGNASAFPLDLAVTRAPRQDGVITFEVTDAATGMVAQATFVVPAFVPAISATGTVLGSQIDAASVTLAQMANERAMAHKSTNTAIPNTTATQIQLDTDDYISAGITRSSNKLTVASAGTYAVTGWVVWEANATGNRQVELFRKDSGGTTLFVRRVSATAISWTPPAGATGNEMIVAFVTRMGAGESFSMNAYQDSGASRNITLAYLEVMGLTG